MNFNVAKTSLTLSTNNVSDVGQYQIEMIISLTSYPAVAPITKHFVVTISCEVQTIAFSLAPANIFIEPGVTAQPISETFSTTQTPNCGHAVTFSWASTVPTFVTKSDTLLKVAVDVVDISKAGTYALTLRATSDSAVVDAPFTL